MSILDDLFTGGSLSPSRGEVSRWDRADLPHEETGMRRGSWAMGPNEVSWKVSLLVTFPLPIKYHPPKSPLGKTKLYLQSGRSVNPRG